MLLMIVYVCRPGHDAKCIPYFGHGKEVRKYLSRWRDKIYTCNRSFPRSQPFIGNWLHQQCQIKVHWGLVC